MERGQIMRRKWMAAMAGLLALLCFTAVNAKTSRNTGTIVLETFAAGGAFQYQIAVEPCIKKEWMECPTTVNLLKNGKRVDRKLLSQAAEDQKFERRLIRPAWTSMLFNAVPGSHTWESGYENAYVGVLARTVPLDAAYSGMLVTQLTGFDTLHRDHVLYVIGNGKLKKIWSFSDSSPPVSSAVYPVTHQGRNYLLFWKSRRGYPDGDDVPDSHQISLLRYQAGKKTAEAIPLPSKEIPLYAVVIAFYPDVVQARQIAEKIDCPNNDKLLYPETETVDHRQYIEIATLATADYPQLAHRGEALLGNLFFTREEAQKYQQELQRCVPAMASEMIYLD